MLALAAKVDWSSHERLVKEYGVLITEVARRVSRRIRHSVDFDDLVSEGTIGLIQAAERFDPSRQIRFEAYASTRIHGAMLDYLRHLDPLSQRRRREASRLKRAEDRLAQRLGRPPAAEEVAAELELPLEQYLRVAAEVLMPALSNDLDAMAEVRSDEPTQEEFLVSTEDQTALRRLLDLLPGRARQVLLLVYFYDYSQKEAARALEVSEPRVSQLRKEGIDRLRQRALPQAA